MDVACLENAFPDLLRHLFTPGPATTLDLRWLDVTSTLDRAQVHKCCVIPCRVGCHSCSRPSLHELPSATGAVGRDRF